jgi:hypothetical protein
MNTSTIETLPIQLNFQQIERFCQERGIRKLSLFGSILRSDYRAESDIDLLVEYLPTHFPGWDIFLHTYELEQLLGKKVDMNLPSMLSPYFRDQVISEALPIYEQA